MKRANRPTETHTGKMAGVFWLLIFLIGCWFIGHVVGGSYRRHAEAAASGTPNAYTSKIDQLEVDAVNPTQAH